jgi:hypothetical protein
VPSLSGNNANPTGANANGSLTANAATRAVRTSNPDAPAWSGTDAELETEPDMDGDEYDEDGMYIDDGTDTGGVSESDWEGRRTNRGGGGQGGLGRGEMGDSALFLGGDTVSGFPTMPWNGVTAQSTDGVIVIDFLAPLCPYSCVTRTDIRSHAGLLDVLLGAIFKGCAFAYSPGQLTPIPIQTLTKKPSIRRSQRSSLHRFQNLVNLSN